MFSNVSLRLRNGLLLIASGLLLVGGVQAAHHSGGKAMKKDIVDTAVGAGQFNTLAAALQAAGLVDTLKGSGPFTVFAPTDAAFAALPAGTVDTLLEPENKDQLIKVLTYHVVPGKVTAAQVTGLTEATTVEGQEVTIQVPELRVSRVKREFDLQAGGYVLIGGFDEDVDGRRTCVLLHAFVTDLEEEERKLLEKSEGADLVPSPR